MMEISKSTEQIRYFIVIIEKRTCVLLSCDERERAS